MSLMMMCPVPRRVVSISAPDTNIYPIDDVGGDAPLYAYGVAKLRKSYSGPALRIIRASDSAELDVGFVGNVLDIDSVNTFISGTTGKVLKFYDQSGNGNDTQTQSTDSLRMLIGGPVTINGFPALDGLQCEYDFPASLAVNTREISHYAVISGPRGGLNQSGVVQFGNSTSNIRQFFQGYSSGLSYIYGTSTIWGDMSVNVVELHTSAAGRVDSQGEYTKSLSAPASATLTGGKLCSSTTVGYKGTFYGLSWIAYGRSLSTGERATVKNSLNLLFNLDQVPGRVVFKGDSITQGSGSSRQYGYVAQSVGLLSKKVPVYNAGVGSQTLQNALPQYAASLGNLLSAFTDNRIVFLMMGTNDISLSARTATDIYADYQTYAANVRASGGKIIVATILPDNAFTTAERTERESLNDLIRTNWASFADGLCDFGADPVMGPQSAAADTSIYADGLHPSELGHSYLAELAAEAINALL